MGNGDCGWVGLWVGLGMEGVGGLNLNLDR